MIRYFSLIGSNIALVWNKLKNPKLNNVFKLIFSATLLVICVWIFIRWNTIPVHEHYIRVERISTNDIQYSPIATVYLNMNYGSTIEEELPRAKTAFNKVWFEVDTTKTTRRKTPFKNEDIKHIIGSELSNELNEKAKPYNLSCDNYKEIFYISDTRSIDNIDSSCSHDCYVDENYATISGINDSKIKKIPLFENSNINRQLFLTDSSYQVKNGKARERKYLTYSGFIFAKNRESVNVASLEFPDDKNNGFPNIFKLKDITQAYYRVKVFSKSIDSIIVNTDFVGAADFSKMDSEPNKITMSSFEFHDFQKNPILNEISFHATFKETENIQVVRCFFLTAVMTIFLTIFFNAIFSIITERFKKKRK